MVSTKPVGVQAAARAVPRKSARRAQPGHGQAGHRDQADHPRHPDSRLQHRDHPGPRPEHLLCRVGDEAYAQIREALHASGDITIHDSTLHIRLDPLSAPRRTRALAALCEQLTATATRYPGTQFLLHYEVKERPGTT